MKIKFDKENSNSALVGNIKLGFTVPIKSIKTVKCRVCNESGDILFCADHIKNNRRGHFEEYKHDGKFPRNHMSRAFDVVEKV